MQDMSGRTADGDERPAALRQTEAATATMPAARIRRLDVAMLLGDGRECIIVHRDSEYRLRITSQGKLILTK
ncbi:hypothetical protein STVA_42990 [Allostella vacuolata]|nr:hypothetical protein STVA_42990 [Stella vacuolata]